MYFGGVGSSISSQFPGSEAGRSTVVSSSVPGRDNAVYLDGITHTRAGGQSIPFASGNVSQQVPRQETFLLDSVCRNRTQSGPSIPSSPIIFTSMEQFSLKRLKCCFLKNLLIRASL